MNKSLCSISFEGIKNVFLTQVRKWSMREVTRHYLTSGTRLLHTILLATLFKICRTMRMPLFDTQPQFREEKLCFSDFLVHTV